MGIADQGLYAVDEARWSSLMASAQAGNEGDYRRLLEELGDVVHRYLTVRMGAHAFVEDCVQEVLIAVHEGRHSYDARRKFRPWLFAITRHKAIDALRRQRARREVSDSETSGMGEPQVTPGCENSVISGRLIEALSRPYRDAIMLTKIVGLSTAEAAKELEISESAVKVRVHRGVSRLRRMLEAEAL